MQRARAFDAVRMMPLLGRPQGVHTHLRRRVTRDTRVTDAGKLPFAYPCSCPQLTDCFALLTAFHGLSDAGFAAAPRRPPIDAEARAALDRDIANRTAKGGAFPES